MRVLVTGASGQLGSDVVAVWDEWVQSQADGGRLPMRQRVELFPVTKADCDIRSASQVDRLLDDIRPHWIVHTAAYTDVDRAESSEGRSYANQVNVLGTRNLTLCAADIGAKMLYVSTDYVFDGRKPAPYTEADQPHPKCAYGQTKWLGEQVVREFLKESCIVRTSWLYGEHLRPGESNFVKTMLQAARLGSSASPVDVRVVDDQIGCPTWTKDLALKLWELLYLVDETATYGTYHLAGGGSCSWFEFARAIFADAGVTEGVSLIPVKSSELHRIAQRPANSVLASIRLDEIGMSGLRHWRTALQDYLAHRN
jgi:dTDP-4-dehydrorhamnose reductase